MLLVVSEAQTRPYPVGDLALGRDCGVERHRGNVEVESGQQGKGGDEQGRSRAAIGVKCAAEELEYRTWSQARLQDCSVA